jgi:hypothetical protein
MLYYPIVVAVLTLLSQGNLTHVTIYIQIFIMKKPWFVPYLSDFSTTCSLCIDCVFLKTAYGPSNM